MNYLSTHTHTDIPKQNQDIVFGQGSTAKCSMSIVCCALQLRSSLSKGLASNHLSAPDLGRFNRTALCGKITTKSKIIKVPSNNFNGSLRASDLWLASASRMLWYFPRFTQPDASHEARTGHPAWIFEVAPTPGCLFHARYACQSCHSGHLMAMCNTSPPRYPLIYVL